MTNDPLIGTQVGNYKIIGLLGEGGMARVYRATHPEIGREVAVKVLAHEVAAMPDVVRRFRVEAQTVNKIDHPNIIHIFDFGNLPDGRQFYLMELLNGESLATRIERGGAMPLDEALSITDSILDALDAVHRAGIVHRDLKPDNVYLAQSGGRRVVKLLDFGIVKLLGDVPFNKTQTGSLLGTPSYMAPEQCQGKVNDIGPRTDIYAVGCILYQMLCGELPFNADSLGGLLLQHMTETSRPLTDRIRGLPLALSQLVQQCLAKEPAARPPSATWLREQLRPFVAQGPALSAAETVAAQGGVAPHALQTIQSTTGRPPVVTPPGGTPWLPEPKPPGASEPAPRHTLPMSSLPEPRVLEAARPRRWPILSGIAVTAIAAIATAVVLFARTRDVPSTAVPADAATRDASEEAISVAAPVDAPQVADAPPPDAAVDAAPDALEGPSSLKTRLEALKRMCADGVFTEPECREKREQLLREWDANK